VDAQQAVSRLVKPDQPDDPRLPRVLHVLVGHGLPTYFLNAARSIRAVAPEDPLLLIDNASPSEDLRDRLRRIGEEDPMVEVILRSTNDLTNRKVGSLYSAYEIAFEYAIENRYDLLHLLQGDFQMMWWDADLVRKSVEIFASHPRCVNIFSQFVTRDSLLSGDLVTSAVDGLSKSARYGLTDTGIYDLARWRAFGMRFGPNEQRHAKQYLQEGLEVICHPWPTDAPIPWPTVVRNGVQRGKEVSANKPFLLKPLIAEQVAHIKAAPPTWLEDECIPWGWACVTPMWVTSIDSAMYWVLRYRDARKNGLTRLLPRLELRGLEPEERRKLRYLYRYRPSLLRLFIVAPVLEMVHRLTRPIRASSTQA